MRDISLNYFRKAILFFVLALLCRVAYGQTISQPIRNEMDIDAFETIVDITPLQDSSILLYKRPYFGAFKAKHHFSKLDKNLKQTWEFEITLEDNQDFHQIFENKDGIYIMYLGFVPGDFYILKINSKSATHDMQRFKLRDFDIKNDVQLGYFKAINDQLFIKARNVNNFFVIHLDLPAKNIKTIPALYDQLSAYTFSHMDTISNRAEFILSESNGIKRRLLVKRFTPSGELMSSNFTQSSYKRSLITAHLSPGDSTQKILVGTYSSRDTRFAQGLFTSKLGASEKEINFIDYSQLKHFFDYLTKGARRRFDRKVARYKAKDKELPLRYRTVLQDLVLHRDTLYLFAEIFQPQETNNNRGMNRFPGVLNMPIPATDIASTYRYSHSIVCAFDKSGKLLWDNSYVLEDVVRQDLEKNSHFAFFGNKIVMAYAHKKDIRYKIINRNSPSDNTLSVPIAPKTAEEKIVSGENSLLLQWYGPHFILFGFQRIRRPVVLAKETFYLSKLTVEDK